MTLTCIAGKPGEILDQHDWIDGIVFRICVRCHYREAAFTIPPGRPLVPERAWFFLGPTEPPV